MALSEYNKMMAEELLKVPVPLEEIAAQLPDADLADLKALEAELAPKVRQPRFSPDQIKAMIDLYNDKRIPVSAITNRFGLSHADFYRFLDEHKVTYRSIEQDDSKEKMRILALQMFEDNATIYTIRDRTGLSPSTINRYVKDSGTKRKPKKTIHDEGES